MCLGVGAHEKHRVAWSLRKCMHGLAMGALRFLLGRGIHEFIIAKG
jgi:hypothetical protein